MNYRETDKAAAKVAQCLYEAGAQRELVSRTLNSLHEESMYVVVNNSGQYGAFKYAIHRVPEDSRPTVEIWKTP